MAKEMTIAQALEMAISMMEENKTTVEHDECLAKLNKMLDQNRKKSATKTAKADPEREKRIEIVLDVLDAEVGKTCLEIASAAPELNGMSTQAILPLVKILCERGLARNEKGKGGKSLYFAA